ncbi:M20/M25/M40 family metallo-hydrolase [Ensifer soli]|uniref:M20/M25/M40 family metallo-hydrolase n=1 Tax=Ciceribacter sp. sgz301302 TaxID=3342379 RepID=UPI0035B77847
MPNATPSTFDRTRDLSLRMTGWESVTGTDGEAEFAGKLAELLREIPYVHAHPDHLLTLESHGDPARRNVVAVVRGRGRNAVVLAGHFDTVSIDTYGPLAPLATQPEALRDALVDTLSAAPTLSAVEARTLADLKGGDFLPGRGLLDMKSGLAAAIVALERFAALPERNGTLIFCATPDEENRSRGMIALRDQLPAIAQTFDLDIVGAINLDSTSDDEDSGINGQALYLGSVGKFSPFAFVLGRQTHAGYAFNGVSAHLIAAELMRAMETNSALCDSAHGETAPAPVCLEARDMRTGYEVTTPGRVWLSFNWLAHRRSAADILNEFSAIAGTAMTTAIALQRQHAGRFFAARGEPAPSLPEGRVLRVDAVRAMAIARGGEQAAARLRTAEENAAALDDPLSATRSVVDAMVTEAGIGGPAIVVGFSTLHYPRVHVDAHGRHGMRFAAAVEAAARAVAERHGTTLTAKPFFAGISDMSFLGHRPDPDEAMRIAANTPCPAFVDAAKADGLSFPVVNIGPWGRDYHQRWERVHMPYSFAVLPEIIHAAALAALGAKG